MAFFTLYKQVVGAIFVLKNAYLGLLGFVNSHLSGRIQDAAQLTYRLFRCNIPQVTSDNRGFTLLKPEKKFKAWKKDVGSLWSSLPGKELKRGKNTGSNCITSSWELLRSLWWNLGPEEWKCIVSQTIEFQERKSWWEKALSAGRLECLQTVFLTTTGLILLAYCNITKFPFVKNAWSWVIIYYAVFTL
jgi:hypothetical protein